MTVLLLPFAADDRKQVVRLVVRLTVLVTLAAGLMALGVSSAAASLASAPKVVVVLAPGLAWSDIEASTTPTLWRLAGSSAIANMNARPKTSEYREPASPLEGAVDISTGNWATPDYTAEGAYTAGEPLAGFSAAEVYRRTTGHSMGSAEIGYVGLPPAERTASGVKLNAFVLGTLGQAIQDAGGSTAAVGNSDAGDTTETLKIQRPAAVAAMNKAGLVRYGNVSRELLMRDDSAPYGLRTDLDAFDRAMTAAETSMAAHGGPMLLVLDPGDAYRAIRYTPQVTDNVRASQYGTALRTLDDVVQLALNHVVEGDTVIVAGIAPGADPTSGQVGLSPVLVWGQGFEGELTSSTTHRSGLVAIPDITATALSRLGIDTPVQVIGNALVANPDPRSAEQRIGALSRVNSTVMAVDSMRGGFTTGIVNPFACLLALVAAFIVFGHRLPEQWRRVVRVILMVLGVSAVAFIAAGWWMFLLKRTYGSPTDATLGLWIAALAAIGLTMLLWRFGRPRLGPAVLLLASSALLAVDQYLGAPLSISNLIGYSPLQASRYYGIGNEAAAFMVACGLIGSALLIDEWPDARWSLAYRRFGVPVVGLLLVVAAAAPSFGANVGVAAWGTAGTFAAWAGMNGRRLLDWRTFVAGVVVVALLLGTFVAIDTLGKGEQTHLGRSVSTAEKGGTSQLLLLVQRKAAGNARILLGPGWWYIAFGASMAFLAFLWWRGRHRDPSFFAHNPAFSAAIVAVLTAGVVGFFTEDTGVLLVTIMSIPLSSAAVWLALEWGPGSGGEQS